MGRCQKHLEGDILFYRGGAGVGTDHFNNLRAPIFENKTGYDMSLINETKTCHTLVLPAIPRPRFIAPWSYEWDQDWDGEQDSLEFETQTKTLVVF